MSADSWSYEDPQFTREMWRMSIAMDASTPGYAQWVQQTKKSLALLQEPMVQQSSSPSDEVPRGFIQTMEATHPRSWPFEPLMSD